MLRILMVSVAFSLMAFVPVEGMAQHSASDVQAALKMLEQQRKLQSSGPAKETRGLRRSSRAPEVQSSSDVATVQPARRAPTAKPKAQEVTIAPADEPRVATPAAAKSVEYGDLAVNRAITFAKNSARLTAQARQALDFFCEVIASDSSGGAYVIVGHTDASGSAEYNMTLSQARADESRRYLLDTCGVPPSRLRAVGEGEQRPLKDASPYAARNRRVELQVGS